MEQERKVPLRPRDALVFFAWVLAVQLTGLAAFTKGFFLTRVELARQSQCDVRMRMLCRCCVDVWTMCSR